MSEDRLAAKLGKITARLAADALNTERPDADLIAYYPSPGRHPARRWYIDVSSGVPPKQFIRGEWFVSIAALTGLVWLICDAAGLNSPWSAGISFVVGFTVRVLALYRGWEEPLAKEPTGVYQHSEGRPLLGRKIKGKSQRELHDLGLVVENPVPGGDG